MRERFPALVAALWWGGLSTLGFWVVPLLFVYLPTPAMAGAMAARLFAAQTWVTVGCCLVLLLASRPKHGVVSYSWAQSAMVFVLGGMLLALLSQFGVAPRIVARQDLQLWHSVGTLLYILQWGCALGTLWHTLRETPTQLPPES